MHCLPPTTTPSVYHTTQTLTPTFTPLPPPPPPSSTPALHPLAALEQAEKPDGEDEDEDDEGDGTQNRAERKARKAIQKLGMKPIPGVDRVVIKLGKTNSLIVLRPDVFKAPGVDTYVFFGEARKEGEAGSSAGAGGAGDFARASGGAGGGADAYARAAAQVRQSVGGGKSGGAEELEETSDESGLEARDIELVMQQAGVTRGKAAAALRKSGGDLVNAIMALTSEM